MKMQSCTMELTLSSQGKSYFTVVQTFNLQLRNADAVRGYIKKRMLSEEDKLQKLERQINPLLDDNDQNQLTFTLKKIIDKFHQIESTPITSFPDTHSF